MAARLQSTGWFTVRAMHGRAAGAKGHIRMSKALMPLVKCCGFLPASHIADAVDWNLLQWPAMVVTVAAAWLVASDNEKRRHWGFWVFFASNLLWIAWGLHSGTWALIVLQLALLAMNMRGARKTDEGDGHKK